MLAEEISGGQSTRLHRGSTASSSLPVYLLRESLHLLVLQDGAGILLAERVDARLLVMRLPEAFQIDSRGGVTGTSWRVHYSLSLLTLVCDFFEVIDNRGEETYKRLPIQRGDIVVRLNTTNFPLVDAKTGQPLQFLSKFRTLPGRQPKEWNVCFEASSGTYTGRLCAIRKSAAAAQRAKERMIRIAKKKRK